MIERKVSRNPVFERTSDYRDTPKNMISIAKFRIEFNNNGKIGHVETDEVVICPVCGCIHLISKGRRKRGVIMAGDEKIVLMIRRLKCSKCEKIHHELPDIIVPYKRHSAETIENIICGNESDATCEDSTIARIKTWWAAMQLYIKSIIASLAVKYDTKLSAEKKLPELVRMLANTHLWPRTRSALTPTRS